MNDLPTCVFASNFFRLEEASLSEFPKRTSHLQEKYHLLSCSLLESHIAVKMEKKGNRKMVRTKIQIMYHKTYVRTYVRNDTVPHMIISKNCTQRLFF